MSDNDWRSTAAQTKKILDSQKPTPKRTTAEKLTERYVNKTEKSEPSEEPSDAAQAADAGEKSEADVVATTSTHTDVKTLNPNDVKQEGSSGSASPAGSGRGSPAVGHPAQAAGGKKKRNKSLKNSSISSTLEYLRATEGSRAAASEAREAAEEGGCVEGAAAGGDGTAEDMVAAEPGAEESKAAKKKKNKKQKKKQAWAMGEDGDKSGESKAPKRVRSAVADVLAYTRSTNKEFNKRIVRVPRGPDGTIGFALERGQVCLVGEGSEEVKEEKVMTGVEEKGDKPDGEETIEVQVELGKLEIGSEEVRSEELSSTEAEPQLIETRTGDQKSG